MTKRRVVMTGLGLITACGQGWEPYWEAVLHGQSHISYLSSLGAASLPVKMAGEITDFNPTDFIKQRKSLKLMSKEIQLAVAASFLALRDAALELNDTDRERFGISLGTGIINNDLDEIGVGIKNAVDETGKFSMKKFGRDGVRSLYPLWFLKYLPNMPACHISIAHGLRGPSNTITTSSTAGAQAIGEAFRVVQRGDADLMLAGSTDSKINAMGISRFQLLGLLSYQDQDPKKAYRPFDLRHDGMVLGEGAGLVLIEEYEHAKKRGAKIYGEVAGYGSSSDFDHNPHAKEDYTGKRMAMIRALDDSGTDPEDVDFILANGSGVPTEDTQEAHAVRSVFESSFDDLLISGVKPITGHLIYGSGGVEVGAGMLAMRDGFVPPLANFENPAVDCDLPFVTGKSKGHEIKSLLVNSFGFGGQNASLVVRKA